MATGTDLSVVLPDRPGAGAQLTEALGKAGVNLEGACAFAHRGETWTTLHVLVDDPGAARDAIEGAGFEIVDQTEVFVVDLEDRPGELGSLLRKFSDAGVNIDVIYFASRNRVVIQSKWDIEKARAALNA